jgi:multidrug efflux pump subunit AcrA (membrane-fusion protein)
VERIAAKSDGATGAFDVEVRLEDAEGLRSGMIGEVRIRAPGAAPGALALPVLSLLDARADQGVVYVVDDDGVAHRRSIRTAGVLDGEVLVVEGLSAGERVVARGAAFVRDGEPVRTAPTLPP